MKKARLTVLGAVLAVMALLGLAAPQQAASGSTRPAHLVVIIEENNGLWTVQHKAGFSYLDSLTHTGYWFAHYAAVTHPSAPNYRAISAGLTGPLNDSSAGFGTYANASLFGQLTKKGVRWAWYGEGMPATCASRRTYQDPATDGTYVLRHIGALQYADVTGKLSSCQAHVRPLSRLDPANLPAVTFITPNLCDDFHGIPSGSYDPYTDCVKGTTALFTRSDNWAASLVPQLTAAGATVVITFDECCGTNVPEQPDYLAETGAGITPGENTSTGYSHYSLLARIEAWNGLWPRLGNSATAKPLPIGS